MPKDAPKDSFREIVEIQKEWTSNYVKILEDIKISIIKLEEVRQTLEQARKIYEKSWSVAIKENIKIILLFLAFVVLIVCALLYQKDLNYKSKDGTSATVTQSIKK